jgi:hypothetical protein
MKTVSGKKKGEIVLLKTIRPRIKNERSFLIIKLQGSYKCHIGSYKGKYYDSHILKLEVQYMLADFVMHSLVSHF